MFKLLGCNLIRSHGIDLLKVSLEVKRCQINLSCNYDMEAGLVLSSAQVQDMLKSRVVCSTSVRTEGTAVIMVENSVELKGEEFCCKKATVNVLKIKHTEVIC